MKTTRILALMAVVGVVSGMFWLGGTEQGRSVKVLGKDRRQFTMRVIPHQEVRAAVAHVQVGDVASICLYGPNLRSFENDPKVVSSPESVAQLLQALRNAQETISVSSSNVRGIGMANKADTLIITFRQNAGSPDRDPVRLSFNGSNPRDDLGVQFADALQAL